MHLAISDELETGIVSLDVTSKLNEKGELISIELLNISSFNQQSILDLYGLK